MWNGGTDAKTGEKLKYVSNDAKTGEKLKNVLNDSKTGEKLKYVSNDAKTGQKFKYVSNDAKTGGKLKYILNFTDFFYCIYMYNLQCIICTQSRGAKMHKNRNDCAKHNIIKYDIKKKTKYKLFMQTCMDIQVHVTGIS